MEKRWLVLSFLLIGILIISINIIFAQREGRISEDPNKPGFITICTKNNIPSTFSKEDKITCGKFDAFYRYNGLPNENIKTELDFDDPIINEAIIKNEPELLGYKVGKVGKKYYPFSLTMPKDKGESAFFTLTADVYYGKDQIVNQKYLVEVRTIEPTV